MSDGHKENVDSLAVNIKIRFYLLAKKTLIL